MLKFFLENRAQIFELTLEHMWLVGAAMGLAVAIGVPLGIALTRRAWLKRPVLDRKSTRLNSSHIQKSRMPSSA